MENVYFEKNGKSREEAIRSLKGCINTREYKVEMKRIEESRLNWRTQYNL